MPAVAVTGRPANHPARRLRGVALVLQRARIDLRSYVLESVAQAASAKELILLWHAPDPAGGAALIGRDRAQEIVLNVVLPFAATDPALRPKALALTAALPALPPYGKTAFLETNLRRPDGRRAVKSAIAQQGLLAFLKDWCSQGGCGRCPLS